jgi:hypothetical protein
VARVIAKQFYAIALVTGHDELVAAALRFPLEQRSVGKSVGPDWIADDPFVESRFGLDV